MAQAFSRILLAYDDTDCSRMALRYACALARTGANLTIAYACKDTNFVSSAVTAGFFPPVDPSGMIAAADEECDSVLKAAVTACMAEGVSAEKVFVHGSLVDGIVATSRKRHADLIVVGTHGRKGVSRAILGSVCERILRTSDVPVLVVTRHAKAPSERVFQCALVAVDESEPSRGALTFAARLSTSLGTRLTLCTAVQSARVDGGYDDAQAFQSDLNAAASNLAQRVEAAAVAAFIDDQLVIPGEPVRVIEDSAIKRNSDVIIVGSHGRRGFQRVLAGSVAETVVRSSVAPVLVVPGQHRTIRVDTHADQLYEKV